MSATQDIVAKLWNLCNVLRDDGVTYSEYVTELTYLLFLKMMEETGQERKVPEEYRWAEIARREGLDQMTHYKRALTNLGDPDEKDDQGKRKPPKDPLVLDIFTDAQTRLRKPANLKSLTKAIDDLNWFDAREEGLGDLYEGLLQKNAEDKKSGAGQYFTPRPLIDCLIRLTKPQLGELIQDPAAGTGGFIVAAHRQIAKENNDLFGLPDGVAEKQIRECYTLAELVPDTHRLCMMNLMLHGIEGDAHSMDTLTAEGAALPKANLILSNPPFGTKRGGGRPARDDFSTTAETSNKQLAFVEHMIRALKSGGRAAVVLPDNVLFEDGVGRRLRQMLMNWCNLHTILRLPTGIFYAQGVKTNVLFFNRNSDGSQKDGTKEVWVYDMRADAPSFGKTRPLRAEDFEEFEVAFGDDPFGQAERQDLGEECRFRRFTRNEIEGRGDNLDISWLRDGEEEAEDGLTDPDDITAAILGHLKEATREIEALVLDLEGGEEGDAGPQVAAE